MLYNILSTMISGIISGIIASVVLNRYYWSIKPKLSISDDISKNEKGEYRIKIVNKSNFYVTNIFIQVQLVKISNGNGGNILNVVNLDIPYQKLQIIDPYDKTNLNAPYAVRFVLPKDLETKWNEDINTYLKLIIYCSNEHNNSSKLYEHIYHKKSCIKNGNFKFGDSLDIE